MDYEQKYNKLVNAIKVLQEANPSDEGIQNWVNDNVPELAESEDEEIKEYLISFIKMESGVNLSPDDAGKILAWLEKQGQKPAWTEADDEELENTINALKGAGKHGSFDWLSTVKWLLTIKQRIGG